MAVGDKIYIATKEYVEQLLDELNNKVDLAVIDTQSGSFVQSTIADDCVAEVVIEGKTVVTPLDPTQDISPDNPATIRSVGDSPFDVVATGKNFFTGLSSSIATDYGVTVEEQSDGSIVVSGTPTRDRVSFRIKDVSLLEVGVPYIFSTNYSGTGISSIRLWLYETTSESTISVNVAPNTIFTLTKKMIRGRIVFTGIPTNASVSALIKPQLEIGASVTSYEPYKGSNKITISSIPIRRIPDTNIYDTLEIFSNGKGRLTQRIGKHIVNNTQPILASTSRFVGDFMPVEYKQINDIELVINSPLFSDMFTQIPASNNNEKYGMIKVSTSTTIVFGLNKNDLIGWNDSLSITEKNNLIRQWFANNPVTIYYKLATPIITEIDLTPLHTYKGITNILTTSQLQPTLAAKFYSRLGNFAEVIMARLDQLTQALLALGGTV